MSALSPIEWTDRTWNPVRGCSRVSEGCRNCYAERVAWRFGSKPGAPYWQLVQHTSQGPKWTGQVRLLHTALNEPRYWKTPSRVFVNSMSDLWHDEVPDDFIDRVFSVMAAHPQHTYQVLTKRPERQRDYMQRRVRRGTPVLPHVWLGVSAEDQDTLDERLRHILATPAALRFLSLEPLLGPVDLVRAERIARDRDPSGKTHGRQVHWVIAGGESGPHARPAHPDWFRSLRDQCFARGVPFFFKQWGAYQPDAKQEPTSLRVNVRPSEQPRTCADVAWMERVGKKAAGRLLDGIEHNGFPA